MFIYHGDEQKATLVFAREGQFVLKLSDFNLGNKMK